MSPSLMRYIVSPLSKGIFLPETWSGSASPAGPFFIISVDMTEHRPTLKMHWGKELAYHITPKSGPMRGMRTLLQANEALIKDLPREGLRQPHWRRAAELLVRAGKTGEDADIRRATDELVKAIEVEGWMSRASN